MCVWRKIVDKKITLPAVKHVERSNMPWACVIASGTGKIAQVDERLKYYYILEGSITQSVKFIFHVQDLLYCHLYKKIY